jgi:FADH2 O2-dependent halogenase
VSGCDFDVVIVGGGPAGAATAAYLGRAGARCAVLEREVFPRPHVGESLVPSTTRVFKELDFLPRMEAEGFPKKYGAVWTSADRRVYDHDWEGLPEDSRVSVRFEERKQEGVDQNHTYHVDRGRFDQLLLEHAEKLGATVRQGTAVTGVEFTDDGVVLTHRGKEGFGRMRARMVVDASGRRTLIGNQLGLRIKDPVFDQYAVHTWFEGFDRRSEDPERADYIWIHFLPVSNSWIWQIPITDTVTSIGVVTQKATFSAANGELEPFFWSVVGSRPDIEARLRAADQVRSFKAEGDYSYAMEEITGDRFVLVGDAARFVDPIFSSGVSIALNGARLASRDILRALEADDFSKGRFDIYEKTMRNGCRHWYEFIRLYYRLNVVFTLFINDPRYRTDVLQLLQGDVYDEEEPRVLGKMRELLETVEAHEDHVWHKLLGTLTSDALRHAF